MSQTCLLSGEPLIYRSTDTEDSLHQVLGLRGCSSKKKSYIRILFFELKIEQPLDLKGWYKKLT